MFQNYFKLALRVLGRRKFFTFISLFGISFTLAILMLITAFLDTELGSHPPFSDKDKMVFLTRVTQKYEVEDTLKTIDSTRSAGEWLYDTTFTFSKKSTSSSSSSASYSFLDKHYRNIEEAENYTFFASDFSFDIFVNSNKLTLSAIYAEASFWEVFDFHFFKGHPFQQQAVDNQSQVVVMTQKASRAYFGTTEVVGKTVYLDGKNYEVIGVVNEAANSSGILNADLYLPVTTMNPVTLNETGFLGSFIGVFVGKNAAYRKQLKAGIDKQTEKITMPDPERYNALYVEPTNFVEGYAQNIYYSEDPSESKAVLGLALGGLLLLFILLPTLNLINLNVSRILERSSEIGVRKAFGASPVQILMQFVFENVILTFIGGLIGFVLAVALLRIINESQVFADIELQFSYAVFFYSLLICLGFGILSGIIPAWRMSKVHIVNALKQNKL